MKAWPFVFVLFEAFSARATDNAEERWLYYRDHGELQILYQGEPIKFLANVGDGGFDRHLEPHPTHRYIFLDTTATLGDASWALGWWSAFDPRTPTDYYVVSSEGWYYPFPSKFGRTKIPQRMRDLLKSDRAHLPALKPRSE